MLRLFLLPLIIAILWTGYLYYNGWTIQQGKKGYVYIIVGTVVMIAFFSLMIYLTQY